MTLGTTSSTALAGDTTTITASQASAITANTAKTGITSAQAGAIQDLEQRVTSKWWSYPPSALCSEFGTCGAGYYDKALVLLGAHEAYSGCLSEIDAEDMTTVQQLATYIQSERACAATYKTLIDAVAVCEGLAYPWSC